LNKVYLNADEAVVDIPDGATVMLNSLVGPGGIPQNLILALRNQGAKNLTIISGNFNLGWVMGRLLPDVITSNILVENKQVKKVILWFAMLERVMGVKGALDQAVARGEVELEIVPMGTLTERIRAGGAGIGGFYSPVGIGTLYEIGKEKRVINGKEYILELPLRADFAFVRAHKADKFGNLVYRGTSRCTNPVIATAGDVVITEVDEIVEPGELDPECIITPGIFIDRIVKVPQNKVLK
jgi:3-oxoacid CoA-transferase subunit A